MNAERKRLVETQARCEHGIVAIDVRRAPVIGKRSVQTLCPRWVSTPQGLTRHPIQHVVSRAGCVAERPLKLSRIVGSAKLIKPRIAFAAFDRVESPHPRRLLARSESDLGNAYRPAAKLRNESSLVVGKRVAIFRLYHRFHIDVMKGDNAHFHRWR